MDMGGFTVSPETPKLTLILAGCLGTRRANTVWKSCGTYAVHMQYIVIAAKNKQPLAELQLAK